MLEKLVNSLSVSPEILQVLSDPTELASRATELFIDHQENVLAKHDRMSVMVSGGKTPAVLFDLWSTPQVANKLKWKQLHFFWADERPVLPTDKESNFGLFKRVLIEKVAIPERNIHRIQTELKSPELIAQRYQKELAEFFSGFPQFDLIFLGMGTNGHTASIFPEMEFPKGGTQISMPPRNHKPPLGWVWAPWIEELKSYRFTVSPELINGGRRVLFLVAGKSKAEMVSKIFDPRSPRSYPVQLIRPQEGELFWLMDRAAASCLQTVLQ